MSSCCNSVCFMHKLKQLITVINNVSITSVHCVQNVVLSMEWYWFAVRPTRKRRSTTRRWFATQFAASGTTRAPSASTGTRARCSWASSRRTRTTWRAPLEPIRKITCPPATRFSACTLLCRRNYWIHYSEYSTVLMEPDITYCSL